MLTQVRRWGWLFNPITVFVVWDDDPDRPVGAVLEVTNTPWKERHRYPIALSVPDGDGWMTARVDKELHVSPFLDEDFTYDVRLRGAGDEVELELDVIPDGGDAPTLLTALHLRRRTATRAALGAELRSNLLPTHRVSAGIHVQAARLWRKGVTFVTHPAKRAVSAPIDDTAAGGTSRSDIHAERLLAHADASRTVSLAERWSGRAASFAMDRLLSRLGSDRLDIAERVPGRPHRDRSYGPGGDLSASVVVVDLRAYSAVLTEGSIGLGRGFIEGWWTSDDPVTVVRVIIRNLGTLDRIRNRWEALTGGITDRLRTMRPRDTRERNREDIGAHYDIGNSFFELFLDETMTYSSAVFPSPDTPLADASRHKYDLLLDLLGAGDGFRLLEIGTGWGGMAIRAAGRGCEVTTTTISAEQLREARKRIADAGFTDRVDVIDDDWRDLSGTYDGVVSIEMIEAVDWRDYDDYFATIDRRLAPGGRAAIQAIVLPDDRWERAKKTEDFIRRFVFPNGHLPSVRAVTASVDRATSLRIGAVHDHGLDYAETLRRWRERFDARSDDVAALGLDARFRRLWRFYLAYCEAGFLERHCSVVQILLEPREARSA
jgi:cyclopropane fatty-acyl-phospholipid synthase-like methyltransferase